MKVCIVKCFKYELLDYNYDYHNSTLPVEYGLWQDITEEDFGKLTQAISSLNSSLTKYKYIMFTQDSEEMYLEIMTDYKKFLEDKAKADAKREKQRLKDEQERKQQTLENKKKKLAKLKKELGED